MTRRVLEPLLRLSAAAPPAFDILPTAAPPLFTVLLEDVCWTISWQITCDCVIDNTYLLEFNSI